jgi:AcrR family transcriptional regulator
VPSASKPRRKAQEIRQGLVEAAGELFAAHGYEGVSVRDIAAAAGVQASVVIRYFGSKEALFRRVLETSEPLPLEPDLSRLPALIARGLIDPPSTDVNQRRSQVHQIFVRSLGSPEARRAIRADIDERYVQTMSGIIPEEDALTRAGLVVTIILGVLMMREVVQEPALVNAEPERLQSLVEGILAQLLTPGATGNRERSFTNPVVNTCSQ